MIKKIILFGIFAAILSTAYSNCGSSGGGSVPASGPAAAAVISGDYWWAATTNNTDMLYLEAKLSGNQLISMQVYFPNGVSSPGFYARSVGTFTVSGDTYNIIYAYETCNPVGSESVPVSLDSAQHILTAKIGKTLLPLKDIIFYQDPVSLSNLSALTEDDVTCSHFPH